MTSSAQNELTKGAKGSEEEAATAATRTAAGGAAAEAPAAVSRAPPPRLQSASSSQLESLHALQQGPTRPLQQQTELAPEQHQEAPPAAQRVLLTRRTLAELLLSRHQLLQLVPLELLLRELRCQQGRPHTSPLVGAVVRVKAAGQYQLTCVAAVSLEAGPASAGCPIELRLHVQPRLPQLGRGHVLPWEVSSTNSLAERDLYERAGRRERAELEARLGVASWDLHEVALAACRLKVACNWAANLEAWVNQHGAELLEQHLAAPPLLQDMLKFLAEYAVPAVPAAPARAAPSAVPQEPPAPVAGPRGAERLQPASSTEAQRQPEQPRQQQKEQQQANRQPSQPSHQAPAAILQGRPLTLSAATAKQEQQAAATLRQPAPAAEPAQLEQGSGGDAAAQELRTKLQMMRDHLLTDPIVVESRPIATTPYHLSASCVELFARVLDEAESPASLNSLAPRMQVLAGTKWTAYDAAGIRFIEFVRLAMVSW
ncbi:hypothetical protein ABPG77_009906 [Micractinium sp. CCAP 211/92]